MSRVALRALLVFCLALAPGVVLAGDTVVVRLLPGYPRSDQSAELIQVRIERVPAAIPGAVQPVDTLFDGIADALREYDVSGDWQYVLPDAPYVEITITIGGKRQTLASAHMLIEKNRRLVATEHGSQSLGGRNRADVLSRQSARFRKNRAAFERIMRLVSERLRNRLP